MTFRALVRVMGALVAFGVLQSAQAIPRASETRVGVDRVVLIGLDGLSRAGLENAPTPYLNELRLKGVFLGQSQEYCPARVRHHEYPYGCRSLSSWYLLKPVVVVSVASPSAPHSFHRNEASVQREVRTAAIYE